MKLDVFKRREFTSVFIKVRARLKSTHAIDIGDKNSLAFAYMNGTRLVAIKILHPEMVEVWNDLGRDEPMRKKMRKEVRRFRRKTK